MATRDPRQVDQLLDQLRAARDAMDTSADTEASRKIAAADILENEAADLEAQIPAIRQRMNLQRESRDQAGRDADAEEIRALLNQASQKQRQAARERMNAVRMLSLKHDTEKATDQEICVHCLAHVDDNGDIVGATHVRHPIEDVDIKDDQNNIIRTVKGLRSLFRDGEADFDIDGTLRIRGRRID